MESDPWRGRAAGATAGVSMIRADPLVSVVIPCWNSAASVAEAVGSMLGQTYRHLEVVVVDDGSADDTAAIVEAMPDPRVRLVRHESNRGTSIACNTGILACRGRYVARMDSDDISLPGRVGAQVRYLEAHPEVGMLGTRARKVRRDRRERVMVPILPRDCLRARCVLDWATHQPTVMMRRSVLARMASWYDPELQCAQDREFWLRLALISEIENLPEVHLVYRGHARERSLRTREADRRYLRLSVRKRVAEFLGEVTAAETLAAEALGATNDASLDEVPLADVEALVERIVARAGELGFCSARAMAASLADLMFARYRRNRRTEWFRGLRRIVRHYEVPLAWMVRASARRWLVARLRHGGRSAGVRG